MGASNRLSPQLKQRLALAAVIAVILLIMVFTLGVNRTIEIVSEVLNPKQKKHNPRHPPSEDDWQLPDTSPPAPPGTYLFCFWNVENLFDDRDDKRKSRGDPEFDHWFGNNPEALNHKLQHLCDVLIPLNGGKGPDILCVAEVESQRAVELLADALNKRLGSHSYTNIVIDKSSSGRHIVPAMITRLPVVRNKLSIRSTRRILGTVVRANGEDLYVIVSHWTSRVTDKTGKSRAGYADQIYDEYNTLYQQSRQEGKQLSFLVCGDFNDNPDDPSVTDHLHAIDDASRVKASIDQPLLFNVFARAYANGQGTLVYGSKKYVFDQICVSPAMLNDGGWTCDVDSAKIITSFADRKGRPNRFGGVKDKRPFSARGASDHFPVTVLLRAR